MLKQHFEEFEMSRLPPTVSELKASPPSGWTPTIDQIAMRSLAFGEFEMISTPLIFLVVVSTSDPDHFQSAQELMSTHHLPASVTTVEIKSYKYFSYSKIFSQFIGPVRP